MFHGSTEKDEVYFIKSKISRYQLYSVNHKKYLMDLKTKNATVIISSLVYLDKIPLMEISAHQYKDLTKPYEEEKEIIPASLARMGGIYLGQFSTAVYLQTVGVQAWWVNLLILMIPLLCLIVLRIYLLEKDRAKLKENFQLDFTPTHHLILKSGGKYYKYPLYQIVYLLIEVGSTSLFAFLFVCYSDISFLLLATLVFTLCLFSSAVVRPQLGLIPFSIRKLKT